MMKYRDTGKFTPTQRKLAKEIAERIEKLRKSGCAIVGKQDCLIAYIHKEYNNSTCDSPHSKHPLKTLELGHITDSGADDQLFFELGYLED